jgi:hypothetical protein
MLLLKPFAMPQVLTAVSQLISEASTAAGHTTAAAELTLGTGIGDGDKPSPG